MGFADETGTEAASVPVFVIGLFQICQLLTERLILMHDRKRSG